jgi:hypothetical protein
MIPPHHLDIVIIVIGLISIFLKTIKSIENVLSVLDLIFMPDSNDLSLTVMLDPKASKQLGSDSYVCPIDLDLAIMSYSIALNLVVMPNQRS